MGVLSICSEQDFRMLCATDPEWKKVSDVWLCSLATGSRGINEGGKATYLLPGDEVWVADRYLRAIKPDDIDESKNETNVIEVTA